MTGVPASRYQKLRPSELSKLRLQVNGHRWKRPFFQATPKSNVDDSLVVYGVIDTSSADLPNLQSSSKPMKFSENVGEIEFVSFTGVGGMPATPVSPLCRPA